MRRPPEKQTPHREALRLAWARLRGAPEASLAALGARRVSAHALELAVLNAAFLIDLEREVCALVAGGSVRPEWQLLALHYLASSVPPPAAPGTRWVGFAGIDASARVYEKVYRARCISRLCAAAGLRRETFVERSTRAGGEPVPGLGDAGFRFQIFPRLAVQVAWYAGDGELAPGAAIVYPENIASFLSVEDVVVLSERLVARIDRPGW